jgi:transposase
MSSEVSRVLGVDVSKSWLDVASTSDAEVQRLSNDAEGIEAVLQCAQRLEVQRITVEASGGWQTQLVAALVHAGLPVVVVNPRQVREFARATGRLADWQRPIASTRKCCAPSPWRCNRRCAS